MKPDRIDSLTGLRAFAMMTVFCSHLEYLEETPFRGVYFLMNNGRFGVNFFLLLSGFVLALRYSDKLKAKDIRQDVRFLKRRVSKIYIPYLITMLLAIPLYLYTVTGAEGSFDVGLLISRLMINMGMMQSAIPFLKYSTSINEVSWFISTIFIIYIFTPGILRLNNKGAKHYTLSRLVVLICAVLGLYCCIYMGVRYIEYIRFANRGLSIIYRNPLVRIFPFLLGIGAYNIYSLMGDCRLKKGSFVEIPAMAVFLFWWMIADETGLPTLITECADMLISLLVVLVFLLSDRGIISILFGKGKLSKLGNLSLEFYLIHFIVIRYGIMAAKHFGLDQGAAVLPLTVLFFATSLCGAWVLKAFDNVVIGRR